MALGFGASDTQVHIYTPIAIPYALDMRLQVGFYIDCFVHKRIDRR